jgi:hypothetical protein
MERAVRERLRVASPPLQILLIPEEKDGLAGILEWCHPEMETMNDRDTVYS